MNKATMRAARRNYAILHNGPSGPARQVECKTAFRIIARNENEYARACAAASSTLNPSDIRATLRHGRCSSNTESVSSRSFLRMCLTVPGPSRKPGKRKKTTVKAITQSRAVSRVPPRLYAVDRFLYNQELRLPLNRESMYRRAATGSINRHVNLSGRARER